MGALPMVAIPRIEPVGVSMIVFGPTVSLAARRLAAVAAGPVTLAGTMGIATTGGAIASGLRLARASAAAGKPSTTIETTASDRHRCAGRRSRGGMMVTGFLMGRP